MRLTRSRKDTQTDATRAVTKALVSSLLLFFYRKTKKLAAFEYDLHVRFVILNKCLSPHFERKKRNTIVEDSRVQV